MSAKILSFSVAFSAVLICFSLGIRALSAQEETEQPANSAAPSGLSGLLDVGKMAQAASDLRKAGEAFEKFGISLDGISGKLAAALATMSSEFDPFGYKTAFRTIGQQTEIIQQQNEIIRELQEREIERLRNENKSLKKQLRKRR